MPVRLIGLPLRQYSHQLGCILRLFQPDVCGSRHPRRGRQSRENGRPFCARDHRRTQGRSPESQNGVTFGWLLTTKDTKLHEGKTKDLLRGTSFSRLKMCRGDRYFSLATTNSGAQSNARLISESGNVQMALVADSAYSVA